MLHQTQRNEPKDSYWMGRAIELALKGKGAVEPNPMVGCIAVRDGEVLAEGYHRLYGGPHAEVEALANLSNAQLEQATVYITLEPCSHWGKTPPCAPLVASKKPKRVVVAMQDPFPEVAGAGIALLRDQGIEVDLGVLELEARAINAPYLKLLKEKTPWTLAKWAMTLDGAIAARANAYQTREPQWISNELSRAEVHRMRSNLDAIIVGIGTVLSDDPLLTARLPDGNAPRRVARRVVLDHQARLPLDSQLIRSISRAPVWVVLREDVSSERLQRLSDVGVRTILHPKDRSSLETALAVLGTERCTNVMIEGGSQVFGDAFHRDLVDQIDCFLAPRTLGGSGVSPVAGPNHPFVANARSWRLSRVVQRGEDLHATYLRERQIESF